MVECEKERGFMDIIKDGLRYTSEMISASIFPPIAAGTEMVMKSIEDTIIRVEKRMLRKLSSLLIIGFGGVLLVVALFFYLREFLRWSNTAAYFSIGIMVFVIGLLLKAGESDR
jgi:hypothetical protein